MTKDELKNKIIRNSQLQVIHNQLTEQCAILDKEQKLFEQADRRWQNKRNAVANKMDELLERYLIVMGYREPTKADTEEPIEAEFTEIKEDADEASV